MSSEKYWDLGALCLGGISEYPLLVTATQAFSRGSPVSWAICVSGRADTNKKSTGN